VVGSWHRLPGSRRAAIRTPTDAPPLEITCWGAPARRHTGFCMKVMHKALAAGRTRAAAHSLFAVYRPGAIHGRPVLDCQRGAYHRRRPLRRTARWHCGNWRARAASRRGRSDRHECYAYAAFFRLPQSPCGQRTHPAMRRLRLRPRMLWTGSIGESWSLAPTLQKPLAKDAGRYGGIRRPNSEHFPGP